MVLGASLFPPLIIPDTPVSYSSTVHLCPHFSRPLLLYWVCVLLHCFVNHKYLILYRMVTCYFYLYKTAGILQCQKKIQQIALDTWLRKKKVKTNPSQNQNKTSSGKAKVASPCVFQTQYKACSLLLAVAILYYWVVELQ